MFVDEVVDVVEEIFADDDDDEKKKHHNKHGYHGYQYHNHGTGYNQYGVKGSHPGHPDYHQYPSGHPDSALFDKSSNRYSYPGYSSSDNHHHDSSYYGVYNHSTHSSPDKHKHMSSYYQQHSTHSSPDKHKHESSYYPSHPPASYHQPIHASAPPYNPSDGYFSHSDYQKSTVDSYVNVSDPYSVGYGHGDAHRKSDEGYKQGPNLAKTSDPYLTAYENPSTGDRRPGSYNPSSDPYGVGYQKPHDSLAPDSYFGYSQPHVNNEPPPSYESYMHSTATYSGGNYSKPQLSDYPEPHKDPYKLSFSPPKSNYLHGDKVKSPIISGSQASYPKATIRHGFHSPFRPYHRKPKADVPAMVRVLSGCRDSEKSADVHNIEAMGLPSHRGSGGACTNAFLASVGEGSTSWVGLLKRMQKFLKDRRLPQVPQLSTNRVLDLHIPFELMSSTAKYHRAVLIGINYVGQRGELKGCHNDVKAMKEYIMSQGFTDTPATMCILCDDGVHAPPIAENIKSAFRWLVEGAGKGHSLFLHYSGHGGSIPDDNGDEEDGMDETIIPADFDRVGHIRDDDIHKMLIEPLSDGVEMNIIMDCCHSGTIIDLPYTMNCTGELISAMDAGEMHTLGSNTYDAPPSSSAGYFSNPAMKYPSHHTSHSPIKTPPKYSSPPKEGRYATQSAFNPVSSPPPYSNDDYAKKVEESALADVYMISGCKDSQKSADVRDVVAFGLPESRGSGGACTNAFLKSHKYGPTSYIGLLKRMHQELKEKRLKQTPQLSTSKMTDLSAPFFVMNPRSQNHRAVLIGINYVGHKGELRGCHNDVKAMKSFLLSQGYTDTPGTMCVLCDDGIHAPPIAANIKSAFNWLVDGAQPGDSLFLHYSGHGGQVRDLDGDEADGFDETIIPLDYKKAGQIIDDDIYKMIVAPLPAGVHFNILMDCCHSGTVIDLPYVLNCTGELVSQMDSGLTPSLHSNDNRSMKKMIELGKDLYKMKKGKASAMQMGQHAAYHLGVNPQKVSGMANKYGFKM